MNQISLKANRVVRGVTENFQESTDPLWSFVLGLGLDVNVVGSVQVCEHRVQDL
jgi:hypothetical protein